MLKVGAARVILVALIACAAVAGATMERPVRPPKNAPNKAEKPIDPSEWLYLCFLPPPHPSVC